MDEFVQWLRVQFDEDDRITRQAAMAIGRTGYENGVLVDPPARWGDDLAADGAQWVPSYHLVKRKRVAQGEKGRTVADCGGFGGLPVAVHVAEHNPARVLREIDAKRRALDHYEAVRDHARDHEAYALAEGAVRKQIQIMALPYADRPGYKEEWQP